MNVLVSLGFVMAEEEGPALESHHPWWPELKEITWGGAALLVVYALLWKFLLPAAKKGLAARTERIAAEIDGAKAERAEAEAALAAAQSRLSNVEAEAARIVAQAQGDAEQLRVDMAARSQQLVAETRTTADAEMANLGNRAGTEVQAELSRLSIGAAERVVTASLDDATQVVLIEDFISAVGAGRAS
jgi:F-type H+-transporting ATPase subunit b